MSTSSSINELSKGILRDASIGNNNASTSTNQTQASVTKNAVVQILNIYGMDNLKQEKANLVFELSDGAYSTKLIVIKDAKETCRQINIKPYHVIVGNIYKHHNNALILVSFNVLKTDISREIGAPQPLDQHPHNE